MLPKTIESIQFGSLTLSSGEPKFAQYESEISFNEFDDVSLVFRFDRADPDRYEDALRRSEEKHAQLLTIERELLMKIAPRTLEKYRSYSKEWNQPAWDLVRNLKIGVLIYDLPRNQVIVVYAGNEHFDGMDIVTYFDSQLNLKDCHFDG